MEERTRQLAAIMFVDMVGYTALMQEDEGRARAAREQQREVLSEVVPRHRGEVLQYYGDGALSMFTSAVEAVECAIEIQLGAGAELALPHRIGVHTGDVVYDGEEVYGDGVNIASRIESLCAPGGVLISGKVHDEIKNQASISTVVLGKVKLKNVKQPVKIAAVTNEGLAVPTADQVCADPGDVCEPPAAEPAQGSALVPDGQAPTDVGAGEFLLRRIKERAIVQWSLVYLVSAWAFVEVMQFLVRSFAWPPMVAQSSSLIAFAGFLVALVVAWYHGERGRQRVGRVEVVIYLVLVLGTGGALTVLPTQSPVGALDASAVLLPPVINDDRPSVAVLPFENLSTEPDNVYFASGLHDQVVTQLQRVAGLRVISRSSVMEYANSRPNMRIIGESLGVSHVIEATVQRTENRLLVNVQLIDARTDDHVWAQLFDQEVSNAFDVQSDIAQLIAEELATSLTAEERGAIAQPPTNNAEAYRLYLQGRDYLLHPGYRRENFTAAETLYQRAVALDSDFALARAELSRVHGLLYWEAFDPSAERLEAQMTEAEAALGLDPTLPQAHAALGWAHYVRGDYLQALDEYDVALEGLPNDADMIARIGYTRRRLGDWPAVFEAFERATALSPRNPNLSYDLGGHSFLANRRYEEAAAAYARAEQLAPDLYDAAIHKGHTYVHWMGQLDTLGAVVARLPEDLHLPEIDLVRIVFAQWNRDPEAMLGYLESTPSQVIQTQLVYYPKQLLAGWAHRLSGDQAAALAAFDSARVSLEQLHSDNPDDERLIKALGYANAGMGRSQDAADAAVRAMRATQRAGLEISEAPGRILALAGLPDLAVPYLEALLEASSPISAKTMMLDPLLDPIRDDPAFLDLIERYGGGN